METERYSSIDLLRFFAAASVAFSHLVIVNKGININFEILSSISVEVFFIISGFVLAPQIINLIKKNSFYNYKIFLIRRWYRTIPLYLLSLILISIILGKIFTLDFIKYSLFLQNFILPWLEDDYFSITWSLSVEEWFYIIFPLFLILIFKIFRSKHSLNIIYACIFFIIIIFLIRFNIASDDDWGLNVRRVVIFRLDSIAFGFLLFFYKDRLKSTNFNKTFLFILLILFSIFVFHILKINATEINTFFQIIFHYVVAIWGLLMVLLFYLLNFSLKNPKIIKINLYLGKISYSIYLFHLIIIYFISYFNFSLIYLVVLFSISQVLISSILYKYFEKPILISRPKYK